MNRFGFYGKFEYSEDFDFNEKNSVGDIIDEELDFLPLFVMNNDIVNDEDDDDTDNENYYTTPYLGESDFRNIIDLIQDVNDRHTQISVEMIKHLGSKVSYPR